MAGKMMMEPPHYDPYRAEDDARTLQRAGEVMGDKKRMQAARKHLEKTQAAVQRVVGSTSKPAAKSSGGRGKR